MVSRQIYMTVCELYYKQFYSRGNGEYLDLWAAQVDRMEAEGWMVLDCCRQMQHPGFWTVILGRPAEELSRPNAELDFPEERER